MTQSLSSLSDTAKQLVTWLEIWRILVLIFGALSVLGGLFGLTVTSVASSQMDELVSNSELLVLIPMLATLGVALSIWVNWRLLSWGKDWVEQATAAVEQDTAAHGLAETRTHLDRWLAFIIWGTLAFMVLAFLLLMGIFAIIVAVMSMGDPAANDAIAGGGLVLLPVFVVAFLLFTYLPLTSLRKFLGDATARLQGAAQAVMPATKRLNIWIWLLIVLQVGNGI